MPVTDRNLIDFAPRALLPRHRLKIAVEITAFEHFVLVQALEERALRYAEDPETVDVADHWFERVAALREACR
jgi:hypothetical protein